MQILFLNKMCINSVKKASFNLAFKREQSSDYIAVVEKTDSFESDNIDFVTLTPGKNLKNIYFKKPLHVSDALESMLNTKNCYIKNRLLNSVHSEDEIIEIKNRLKDIKELENIKINKTIGIGAFAFVFETEDGDVLKVLRGNHFPENRKPAFFDLPIKKHGENKGVHYYIEEKVSQEDISQEELQQFIKRIEKAGYVMADHIENYPIDDDGEYMSFIAIRQFGKTKDGTLYLIDPGCAKAPEKPSFAQILKIKLYNIIFEN